MKVSSNTYLGTLRLAIQVFFASLKPDCSSPTHFLTPGLGLLLVAIMAISCSIAHAQSSGSIELGFFEESSSQPLVCRVQLLDSRGRPRRVRGAAFHKGWSLVDGKLEFQGPPGNYTYRATHGPQFAAASGGFTLDKQAAGVDSVYLPRHANLADESWLGGDLLVLASANIAADWLPAEDLDMAVCIANQPQEVLAPVTKVNSEWVESHSFRDSRPGSGLVLHHWQTPAEVPESVPSSRLLVMAKKAELPAGGLPVHAEVQRLWARDLPIWLASGMVDSIQLLSEHLTYDGTGQSASRPLVDPAPGIYHGNHAAGRTIENIYWRVLDAGLRIPPTAGSGFGKNASPLGYNRVYAKLGSRTPWSWWQAIESGNSFVSNGPLLRATVNGEDPGKVFEVQAGQELTLDVALALTVSDPVDYLDVIYNGETLYQARLDEFAKQGGKIPLLKVDQSGWIVVRVVTRFEPSYRLATTAPYYIQVAGQPRISRGAVAFFQTWLSEAKKEISRLDEPAASAAEPYITAAERFWENQLNRANAP
ncbi:MAG: hypothetical protein KDB22_06555 [Planctomycetales bacterium]|nr:hypothetical protein [Planctomycetales bacterium]